MWQLKHFPPYMAFSVPSDLAHVHGQMYAQATVGNVG